MHKVEFEQGSQQWLEWRKKLLTATDAPGLMGASPYVTPYKLWQRKIGKAEEQSVNSAMLRGQRDEPIARDWFNESFGFGMIPCCIESEKYNFLGASLDGLSACGKYILEVKSNGDQYHHGLNGGNGSAKQIPDFHMMQMQHQMLCTDGQVEKCFYLSVNKNEKIVIEVFPDKKWAAEYIPKALDFWRKIVMFEEPDMTDKDYVNMNHHVFWCEYAEKYRKACDDIKSLEYIKNSYREELIRLCKGQSSSGGGIKIMKKSVRGRVDYDKILQEYKVDQETYRKPSMETWTIVNDK